MSLVGYHLSQTLFVPSASRCWLSVAGFITQSKKSYQILPGIVTVLPVKVYPSIDAVPGPRFSPLTEEVIIRSLHLVKAHTSTIRLETHPAVRLLPVWQKAPRAEVLFNGLPGDLVAEPQRGASSSALLISLPLGSLDGSPPSSRHVPHNGSRKLCVQIMYFRHSRILCAHKSQLGNSWH